MKNTKLRNDILLVLALALMALGTWAVIRSTQSEGKYAVVEIDGVETARYPLDEDLNTVIETELGCNVLVIEGGAARVEEADCPDKLCVKQHAVRRTGETVICLPHRLVIRIEGEGGVDATT